jgi:SAM-dependent methyltransferase/Co/Zn/Cd efflux system component
VDAKTHWEKVYASNAPEAVSWYRPHLETSLALIERAADGYSASIIDVGGGESTLADDLLARGYEDITVLDVSQTAVDVTKKRLGLAAEQIHWLVADITEAHLEPGAYDVWHDRAVFHFLTASEQRAAYVRQVGHAVNPGGHVIVSTFGPEGPTKCGGSMLFAMTPNLCMTSSACASAWWKAQRNYIAHHLAPPSNFYFATARSNEQNHPEHPMTAATSSELPDVSRRILQLQVLTIVWMTVEAVVSLGTAWSSHSAALFAFGGDSLIELLSAAVVFWRFRFTLNEARAARIAGVLLFALAGLVTLTSVLNILGYREAQRSLVGIGILLAAAVVMPWLASRKRQLAAITSSAALKADAAESSLCGYMAWIALAGLLLNAIWGKWWADPVVALTLVPLIVREGWEAVRSSRFGCQCPPI